MPAYEYFYVRAPLTGTLTALDTYCGTSTPHPTRSGYSSARDVSAAPNTNIVFYGSTNVRSIRVTSWQSSICSGYSAPWSNGVKVDFYKGLNGTQYIGTVYYGHVQNPSNAGIQNTRTWTVGQVPSSCPDNPCDPNDICYTGGHNHMEKMTSPVATAMPLSCWQTVYAGSTNIYRWQILI